MNILLTKLLMKAKRERERKKMPPLPSRYEINLEKLEQS